MTPYFSQASEVERPPSISLAMIVSMRRFSSAFSTHSAATSLGTTSTPSSSPTIRSPGSHRHLGDPHRLAVCHHPAPAALVLRVGAAGEDRQRHLPDLPRIPHVAVEHGAGRALRQCAGSHQLAPEREGRGAGGGNVHLVDPERIEGLEHEAEAVVVRRRRDLQQRHRPADQPRSRHGRLDGRRQELVAAAESVEHVAELRGGKLHPHRCEKRVGNLGHGVSSSGGVGRLRPIRVAMTGW